MFSMLWREVRTGRLKEIYEEVIDYLFGEETIVVPPSIQEAFLTEDGILFEIYMPTIRSYRGFVLLHGVGGSSRATAPLAVELAKLGYTSITYTQRGHVGNPHPYNLDKMVSDACTAARILQKHYNLKNITIVGHSLGGLISQRVVARCSEYFDSMVIVSSLYNARGLFLAPTRKFVWNGIEYLFFDMGILKSKLYKKISSDFLLINFGNLKPVSFYYLVLSALATLRRFDAKKIKIPMLIIHGTNDNVIPFENAFDLMRRYSTKKYFFPVFKGDHSLIWKNAPLVASKIVKWINEVVEMKTNPKRVYPEIDFYIKKTGLDKLLKNQIFKDSYLFY